MNPPETPEVPFPRSPPTLPASLRLLVADDDVNLREALGEYFARKGFAVQLAASGLEAIELLRRRTCDISVLDGHMPGLTGPQVLRKLLDDAGPSAIPPTVLVSSDASIEAWVHQWSQQQFGLGQALAPNAPNAPNAHRVQAPGVGFVLKPIRLEALRRSIQQLLERQI